MWCCVGPRLMLLCPVSCTVNSRCTCTWHGGMGQCAHLGLDAAAPDLCPTCCFIAVRYSVDAVLLEEMLQMHCTLGRNWCLQSSVCSNQLYDTAVTVPHDTLLPHAACTHINTAVSYVTKYSIVCNKYYTRTLCYRYSCFEGMRVAWYLV